MAADLSICPSVDALEEMAAKQSGLSDFGDPKLREPLEILVSSYRNDAWPRMSQEARRVAIDTLVNYLVSRAQIIDDRKIYPGIAEERIQSPFIVVGPPRSGSTLMHTLLSLDPANLSPPHWSCLEPSPPPGLAAPDDARLEKATGRIKSFFDLIPDMYVQHSYLVEEGANALGECGSDIMVMAATTKTFWYYYPVDSYMDYLLSADNSAALAFHHQFLQHSQWRKPQRRWALKGADHMVWLKELANEYPDALLLWTHRDLEQLMSSTASVLWTCRGVGGVEGRGAQQDIAQEAVALEARIFEHAMNDRDVIGERRFLDVSYHEVMRDPLGSIERIYAHAGQTLSAAAREAIQQWVKDNPQTKHGVHKHSADHSGLKADEVNRQFARYRARFGFGFGERATF